MHQVRAHLAYVGSPITGDTLYGGKPLGDDDGFFLHAADRVPFGGEKITVEAPLPARFPAALATARPLISAASKPSRTRFGSLDARATREPEPESASAGYTRTSAPRRDGADS